MAAQAGTRLSGRRNCPRKVPVSIAKEQKPPTVRVSDARGEGVWRNGMFVQV